MKAPQAPLVVLAAVEGESQKRLVADRMSELATKWRLKTSGTGKVLWNAGYWKPIAAEPSQETEDEDQTTKKKKQLEAYGREVVFAYMDLERWKDWLKSMYGITSSDKDNLDNIPVVVADHLVRFSSFTPIRNSRILGINLLSSRPIFFKFAWTQHPRQ